MQDTGDRHRIRQQLAHMPPCPLGIHRGKVPGVEECIPGREGRGGFVILRPGQLEFLDFPSGTEIVFVLVDFPESGTVFAVRVVSLLPMRFTRMRGEPTIRARELYFFHRAPRRAVRLGIRRPGRLGLRDGMIEADGTGREGLYRPCLFPQRRDRGRFERMEEIVGPVQGCVYPRRRRVGRGECACRGG